MQNSKTLKNIAVLLALLAVILLPPILTGLQMEKQAGAAEARGDFPASARLYEAGARRLPWRADLWQNAGLAACAGGDFEEGIRLLGEAQARAALTLPGQRTLGQAFWQTGNREAALATWESALADYDPDPELLEQLAGAYHTLGHYEAEETALRELLALRPQEAKAHYRLGLLLAASQPEAALPELMEAAQLDPKLDTAVQQMRKALNTALLLDEPAYRLAVAGQGLAQLDEWSLAERSFQEAVQTKPDYAEAWAWLGEARQHLGQDGSTELEHARRLSPGSALVHILSGLQLQRQGQDDLALEQFQSAAALEPDSPVWQAALAEAEAQAGDLQGAFEAHQKATRLAPQEAQYWRRLAAFCAQYEYQTMEVGIPSARQALRLDPQDAKALDVMGWLYLNINNRETAKKYFEQALEADPALASAHLHLGVLYLQAGQPELARLSLQQALALDPEGPLGEQAQMMLAQYFP